MRCRRQINPHFLFNTLNSIGSLVRFHPEMAREMIVRLANILRALLRDHDSFVPFRDELAFTDDYLGIEVVRFGADKLRVEREIEPETLEVMVPSMVLQPLIENSIKHGLEPRLEGGTVTLRSRVREGRLVVDVEDDGVGIMPARAAAVGAVTAQSRSGNGIGMKNVRERLEVLYGGEARFEVESRPGRGTRVTLEMPMVYEAARRLCSGSTCGRSARVLSEYLLVVTLVERNDARSAKAVLCGLPGGCAHGFQPRGILQQINRALRHAFNIADREKATVDAVFDQFRHAADASGNGRDAAGHRLQRSQTEGFELARHQHQVGERKQLGDAILLAQKVHALANAEAEGEHLGLRAVRTVTHQKQVCGNFLHDAGEDLNAVRDALDRAEVGEMDQQLFAIGRPGFACLRAACPVPSVYRHRSSRNWEWLRSAA